MKSARKMFEDMGFQRSDYIDSIEYTLPDDCGYRYIYPDVEFLFDDREIFLHRNGNGIVIDRNLYKVIQKQIEEWGWLE